LEPESLFDEEHDREWDSGWKFKPWAGVLDQGQGSKLRLRGEPSIICDFWRLCG